MLVCVEQMTGAQIGELLGIPVVTVKCRLSLARKSLARLLADKEVSRDERR